MEHAFSQLLSIQAATAALPKSVTFLCVMSPSFLPISSSQSAGFSSKPKLQPSPPHALSLCTWERDCLSRWDSEGEEKLKVKQQSKRSSTPSLPLQIVQVQAKQGMPADRTTADFIMTLKHKLKSQRIICTQHPPSTLFPACPICILSDTSHHFLWQSQ